MKNIVRHTDRKNNVVTYKLDGNGREVARIEKRDFGYEYLCIFYWLNNPNEQTFAEGCDTLDEAIDYVDECLASSNCKVYWN